MRGLTYFFFSILIRVSPGTSNVVGHIGHNVTLPCRYEAQTLGILSFCWGQGTVPRFKCSNTILSSQDGAVDFRQSPRYQLLGRVTDGDVSLTIMNAQWDDAGMYGCRVEIPGLFNDHKVNTNLILEEEMLTTSPPENVEVDDETWTNMMGLVGRVRTEGKFKAFLEVGNIGRTAVIFFCTLIIILAFIFRRLLLSRRTAQHINTSAEENIYESIPMR